MGGPSRVYSTRAEQFFSELFAEVQKVRSQFRLEMEFDCPFPHNSILRIPF